MQDPQDEIYSLLRKNYFWDIDVNGGRPVSRRLVVERVFNFGNLREVALVMKLYGRQEVEKILLDINYMDPKTFNFVSMFFKRPKNQFRCYTRRQSTAQYWDY